MYLVYDIECHHYCSYFGLNSFEKIKTCVLNFFENCFHISMLQSSFQNVLTLEKALFIYIFSFCGIIVVSHIKILFLIYRNYEFSSTFDTNGKVKNNTDVYLLYLNV